MPEFSPPIVGNGSINYWCVSCGLLIAKNVSEGMLKEVQVQCPRCGVVNLLPEGGALAPPTGSKPPDIRPSAARVGKVEAAPRNSACPCGSGKKYKRCCGAKKEQRIETGAGMAATSSQPAHETSNPLSKLPRIEDCVVPLVGKFPDGKPPMLFGTGFLVAPRKLVTAYHVVAQAMQSKAALVASESRRYREGEPGVFQTSFKQAFYSEQLDLALLDLAEWRSDHYLPVSDRPAFCNFDLFTMEFAQSRLRRDQDRAVLVFNPAVRRGHVVRRFTDTFLGQPPQEFLELSFPVLRGASGAPLMLNPVGVAKSLEEAQRPEVMGVLVQNIQYEIQPAQIEETKLANGTEERVLYCLPSGVAVPGERLKAFLTEAKVRGQF